MFFYSLPAVLIIAGTAFLFWPDDPGASADVNIGNQMAGAVLLVLGLTTLPMAALLHWLF